MMKIKGHTLFLKHTKGHTLFSQKNRVKKSNPLKRNHFRNILILTIPNPAMAQGLLNIPTANAKLELGAPG
jgi:hypothetical protein